MTIDVREMFDLKETVLCYGQTAYMSGPQDSAGKQPHTMAMTAVKKLRDSVDLQFTRDVQFLRLAHVAAVVDCKRATAVTGHV